MFSDSNQNLHSVYLPVYLPLTDCSITQKQLFVTQVYNQVFPLLSIKGKQEPLGLMSYISYLSHLSHCYDNIPGQTYPGNKRFNLVRSTLAAKWRHPVLEAESSVCCCWLPSPFHSVQNPVHGMVPPRFASIKLI